MNFSDALGLIRSGIPCRRSGWQLGDSLQVGLLYKSEELALYYETNDGYRCYYVEVIEHDDLQADDWERVTPAKDTSTSLGEETQ